MARPRTLPYVDPHKPRGRLYLAVARLSSTELGAWFSTNVAWKLDPLLLKLSGGRLSTTGPLAAALLIHAAPARASRAATPRSTSTTAIA